MSRDLRPSALLAGAAVAALTALAAAPALAEPVQIAVAQPNVEHPYRVGGIARAKAWAEKHPDVTLTVVDGRRDSAVQLAGLEDLISRKVNIIVMSPNDSNALAPIADEAQRAGIPLVVFDRKLNVDPSKYAAFIGSDNVEMGRVAARFIAQQTGGKGKVIQIEGTPGASATTDRKTGFEEELTKYPDITVVSYVGNYRLHEAVAVMEDALTAHRDVKAVFAHNDSMALGAGQVLGERGIKDVVTIGMDGAKEGCDGIADGKLTGSVYYPTMFPEVLEIAMKVLAKQPVEKSVLLETPVISKANYDQFCK